MRPTKFVDVGASILYAPSIKSTFGIYVQQQIYGSKTQLFSVLGLEEFAPQPGLLYSLRYEVRW